MIDIEFPTIFQPLFQPARYKIFYGGRGGAKTNQFAIALLLLSLQEKCTILCCREYQVSIKNSVYKVLINEINRLELTEYFKITQEQIVSVIGSEFIFAGLHNNVDNIKSIPNIKYCWVEEAQSISQNSLDILIPTIRADNSEIWFSLNPNLETDPMYQLILNPPPNSIVVKTNYADNPWFPQVLREDMEYLKLVDYESYQHIWEGETIKYSEAIVFNKKYFVEPVNPNHLYSGPYFGCDFGDRDPTVLVKCWVYDKTLYIQQEAYQRQLNHNQMIDLFLSNIPGCDKYTIRADCSRPDTIRALQNQGLPKMIGCKKHPGSIEDGISYMKSFKKIIIDPSCKFTLQEFSLYKYKVDKLSGDVLPDIAPGNDHVIDSIRYALEPLITHHKPGQVRVR